VRSACRDLFAGGAGRKTARVGPRRFATPPISSSRAAPPRAASRHLIAHDFKSIYFVWQIHGAGRSPFVGRVGKARVASEDNAMGERIAFRCTQCEKVHEGLPAIAFDAPFHYYALSEEERLVRALLTDDTCVVDNEAFYVRAVLELPIVGESEYLEWGVWGSLSKPNFERYCSTFEDNDQARLGPMFSWFASRLPGYPDTISLRCNLVPSNDRKRPLIDLHPDDQHPLALDKRNGITLQQAIAFVMPVLHKH
jgi:hypothetical protein